MFFRKNHVDYAGIIWLIRSNFFFFSAIHKLSPMNAVSYPRFTKAYPHKFLAIHREGWKNLFSNKAIKQQKNANFRA